MSTQLRERYVEKIRSESTHSILRLFIAWAAGLSYFGLTGLLALQATFAFSREGWLWVLYVVLSIAGIWVLQNLAVLVVDIADMLIEQGTMERGRDNDVVA
jgi:hypothetical protein